MVQRALAFFIAACSADQRDPFGFCPLAGDQAYPARCCVEQNRVAGFQRCGAVEKILHRQAFQHHCSAFFKADRLGQNADLIRGHNAHFAIGAGRGVERIGDPIARFQMRDIASNRVNKAGGLCAQCMRQGHRV